LAVCILPGYPVLNIVKAGVRLGGLLKCPPSYRSFFLVVGRLVEFVRQRAS